MSTYLCAGHGAGALPWERHPAKPRDPRSAQPAAQPRTTWPPWSSALELSATPRACPPCSSASTALGILLLPLPHFSLTFRRTTCSKVDNFLVPTQSAGQRRYPGWFTRQGELWDLLSPSFQRLLWPLHEFIQFGRIALEWKDARLDKSKSKIYTQRFVVLRCFLHIYTHS